MRSTVLYVVIRDQNRQNFFCHWHRLNSNPEPLDSVTAATPLFNNLSYICDHIFKYLPQINLKYLTNYYHYFHEKPEWFRI